MPEGKRAGVACVHLDAEMRCRLFADPRRPALCDEFQAEREICGDSREQALQILDELEILSKPENG